MMKAIDAELTLRKGENGYLTDLRIDQGEDADLRLGPFTLDLSAERLSELTWVGRGSGPASGDLASLSGYLSHAAVLDPGGYAQALTRAVFTDERITWTLAEARGIARGRGVPLRLRISINQNAPELSALRWELLCIPGTQVYLSMEEDILFSRYFPTSKAVPAPKPRGTPRALVAIASPKESEAAKADWNVQQFDIPETRQCLLEGLEGMTLDWLPGSESEGCSLARLTKRLPGHDVLAVIANGLVSRNGLSYALILQDKDGKMELIRAEVLIDALRGTRKLPRLVVLAACDSSRLAAPLLAETGIPAVIAMQGLITLESAYTFLNTLFQALSDDGMIDRAVSIARQAIRGRMDEWVPVLFMSLISGRLWREAEGAAAGAPGAQAKAEPAPSKPEPDAEPEDLRARLYKLMKGAQITQGDLEEICFLSRVDWESLKGETKEAKARAMLVYFEKQGGLDRLAALIRKQRPDIRIE